MAAQFTELVASQYVCPVEAFDLTVSDLTIF